MHYAKIIKGRYFELFQKSCWVDCDCCIIMFILFKHFPHENTFLRVCSRWLLNTVWQRALRIAVLRLTGLCRLQWTSSTGNFPKKRCDINEQLLKAVLSTKQSINQLKRVTRCFPSCLMQICCMLEWWVKWTEFKKRTNNLVLIFQDYGNIKILKFKITFQFIFETCLV